MKTPRLTFGKILSMFLQLKLSLFKDVITQSYTSIFTLDLVLYQIFLIKPVLVGEDFVIQQIWWVVWGTFCAWKCWMGTIQLCHACQFLGEAFMVPWTNFQKCCGIPSFKWHQWIFPSQGIRIITWTKVYIIF